MPPMPMTIISSRPMPTVVSANRPKLWRMSLVARFIPEMRNSLRLSRFAPAGFRRADALSIAQFLLGLARLHNLLTHRRPLCNFDRFATAQPKRHRAPLGLAVLVDEDARLAPAPL